MYLKGLVLNGFKSFSSRVEIEFNKGIVGIIGPNGSGKSNILDAVLWVLGEQSYKSIRAKESSDVIFSGGKNKKARSSATVSLIIDNVDRYLDIDSDTVVIERSINRESVSTYSINDKKVRLKDVNELFMDTGIGKQAYSVIGQGKVERIISSSSVELRNIIDEAAGIKKAKFEKEESLKRLKSVENEIEKIELVEKTLKERVESLQEQSKKARIYNTYTQDINALKYMVSTYKVKNITKENEDLKIKEKDYNEKYESLNKELEKTNVDIENSQKRKQEIENDLDNIFNAGRENDIITKELKEKEDLIFGRKTNFEIDSKNKEIREKELGLELKDLSSELVKINEEKDEIEKNLFKTNEKSNELEALEKNRIEKENLLNEKIANSKKKEYDLEIDKIKISADNEDIEKRITSAKKRQEVTSEEYEITKNKLEELEKNFTNSNFDEKLNENEALRKEYNELNTINGKNKIKYQDLLSEYMSIKTRLENLSEMNKAVQFIHGKSKEDKEVLGPLISMIEIPTKYQLAASIIAGYSFNDIVVTKDTVANKYIKLLKENKIGQVSFLPLNRIKGRNLDYKKYEDTIYLRDVIKKINDKEEIDKLIEYIFSNTLVVDDIEKGLKLKDYKDKIVSLSGDLISPSGRITGGYINKKIDETLLKRDRLNVLEDEIRKIKAKIKEDSDKISKLDEIITKNEKELNLLKEKYQEYKMKKNSLKRELDTYIFEIDDNNTFITTKTKELNTNIEVLNNIEKELEESKLLKEKLEKDLALLLKEKNYENELNQIKIENAIFAEKYNNINEKYKEKNSAFEKKNEEHLSLINFINNKDEKYKSIEKELEEVREKLNNLKQTNTLNNNQIEKLTKENANISNDFTKYMSAKNELELNIMDVKNRLEKLIEKYQKNLEVLNDNKSILADLEVFKEQILKNINYIEIDNETTLSMSYKKISVNEKSRANLGDVNLSAIEEYNEVNEKYEKLVNEKYDLFRSKEQILDLIKEIDDDIINKFNFAIEKISENFKYMCYELLHKAKGNIKINNIDDPINTGIELSVKYKNKPEQSLSLLSGGEKSMLAVAFIMSIFMFKPSPFTFFDEVEAALDENNTKKLIALLKQFNSSQFILITHNKETMKGADRLYGVTMKKDVGESIIVSVDI